MGDFEGWSEGADERCIVFISYLKDSEVMLSYLPRRAFACILVVVPVIPAMWEI